MSSVNKTVPCKVSSTWCLLFFLNLLKFVSYHSQRTWESHFECAETLIDSKSLEPNQPILFFKKIPALIAGDVVWSVKHLLDMHEDLSLDP